MPGLMAGLTMGDGLKDLFIRWNFREPGSSTIAGPSDDVYYYIFIISTFFFVLLMVLMVWFAFKYRRRPGSVPQRSPEHNTILELAWSVIPTILLVWMFFMGFWGFADQIVAPSNSATLEVQAQRWSWSLRYPNGATSPVSTRTRAIEGDVPQIGPGKPVGAQETPIFVVPEGRPVLLRMVSIDVIHSFWVPDFRAKFDVFPNRYTSTWFEPTKITGGLTLPSDTDWKQWAGTPYEDHWVFCAEYCGASHSDMYAILRVVPYQTYLSILESWAQPKGEPWEKGKFLFKAKGCYSCHTIDGSKLVGPTWKNMYGHRVEFTDGTSIEAADDAYLRESILEPAKKIVKTYPNQMTFQRVTEEEISYLIAYMHHLSDKGPPPLEKPAQTGTPPAEPAKK